MNHQFHFRNFEPDTDLRLEADLVLSRTLDAAPYGALVAGFLEKQEECLYFCALDIHSQQGPFMASAIAPGLPEREAN